MGSDLEQDMDISAFMRSFIPSFIPQIFNEGLRSVRPGSRPY